jgi:DNA-binding CsgD family transcriptional regulator
MLIPEGNNHKNQNFDLLQSVIASFMDGILILTITGELVHANEYARNICRQLIGQDTTNDGDRWMHGTLTQKSVAHSKSNIQNLQWCDVVPQAIWRVCQSLIESRELFPTEKILVESEIITKEGITLRIRVRWLKISARNEELLLVTVEDCQQYAHSIAIADAQKYNLTDREMQVWLLRRANHSYQEIANQLYITINTVKKHLKNIYAKQQHLFCANSLEEAAN